LNAWDNELHRSLAHSIRRHIIEILQEKKELSFNELLKCVAISNHGRLGFHVRALKGLVESDPSTKKYHLTEKGQLAAELIWDNRILISRRGLNLEHEPRTYARRLRLEDHAILFCDRGDFKREISFPFLLVGLLKGEATVYIVSKHKLNSESLEIQRHGMDVNQFRKEAFTIISAEEWYLEKGKAQAETIIDSWLKLAKEKQKAGFAGLRAAAEMNVFFESAKEKELLRYEAALGRQLPPNLCALCIYNTHRLDEEKLIQLIKSHGHSIFKGIGTKTT